MHNILEKKSFPTKMLSNISLVSDCIPIPIAVAPVTCFVVFILSCLVYTIYTIHKIHIPKYLIATL